MHGIENGIWRDVLFEGEQESVLRNCFSSEPAAVLLLWAEPGVCSLLSFVFKTRQRERFGSHGFMEAEIGVRNEGRRWLLYVLYIFSRGGWWKD